MHEAPFLPRRKSVRIPTFDYSQPSAYFLTICAQDSRSLFGYVSAHATAMNALGRIVDACWMEIPRHTQSVELAPHVVMPNHLHGIVIIRPAPSQRSPTSKARTDEPNGSDIAKEHRRAQHAVPLRLDGSLVRSDTHKFAATVAGSIPAIVRSFKSASTKRIREHVGIPDFAVWQRGYYEKVIWTEKQFLKICEYIRMNPAQWEVDEENAGTRR
jgi:putative transposase